MYKKFVKILSVSPTNDSKLISMVLEVYILNKFGVFGIWFYDMVAVANSVDFYIFDEKQT